VNVGLGRPGPCGLVGCLLVSQIDLFVCPRKSIGMCAHLTLR